MNQMVVVDTDILIDAGRSTEEALACLQKLEQEKSLSMSVATQMELMVWEGESLEEIVKLEYGIPILLKTPKVIYLWEKPANL